MKKEPIDQLFNRLKGELDIALPSTKHSARFKTKLEAQEKVLSSTSSSKIQWMGPLLVAASLLLVAGIIFNFLATPNVPSDLADVSPEMQETQDFFINTIERELFEIKDKSTPENKQMVEDAIHQLEILESDYNLLKNDLSESGEDKRVIYAMIDNFQNRIDLLQSVVEQMKAIKEINTIQPASNL